MSHEYIRRVLPEGLNDKAQGILQRVGSISQFAGDFNPIHIHDANLSGVAFLKMPPGFEKEYAK